MGRRNDTSFSKRTVIMMMTNITCGFCYDSNFEPHSLPVYMQCDCELNDDSYLLETAE